MAPMSQESNHEFSHLGWTEKHRKGVYHTPIFDLVESERASEDGRTSRFVLVDCPDWVNIVAVVKNEAGEDCFLLVRQFRPGGEVTTLEFPGGMVDPGEDPVKAAGREFAEESGYRAGWLEPIGRTNPNPAFMTNTVHTFVAHDVHPITGERDLDSNEIVDVELIPVERLLQQDESAFFTHGVVIVALYWYEHYLKTRTR